MRSFLPTKTLAALAFSALGLACSSTMMAGGGSMVRLSGDQESPPVKTSASGSGTIKVAADGAVSGSVTVSGLTGMAAHIHTSPTKGANGPVIVTLTQTSPGVWAVPAGAKLTSEQMKAYADGLLYVNVHTAENKGGEIRGALTP